MYVVIQRLFSGTLPDRTPPPSSSPLNVQWDDQALSKTAAASGCFSGKGHREESWLILHRPLACLREGCRSKERCAADARFPG